LGLNIKLKIIYINNIYKLKFIGYKMEYKIFHSARFDRELAKFDSNFQNQVDKIENQLIKNPYVGDPLNVKWFREKKIDKYRIYYIIYDDLESVFMVAISEKKDQQKVINTIRLLFDFLRDEIEKIL
jgi:mRNA-degrading endonuclease RelE of RelBE toxin-antitoxin system